MYFSDKIAITRFSIRIILIITTIKWNAIPKPSPPENPLYIDNSQLPREDSKRVIKEKNKFLKAVYSLKLIDAAPEKPNKIIAHSTKKVSKSAPMFLIIVINGPKGLVSSSISNILKRFKAATIAIKNSILN